MERLSHLAVTRPRNDQTEHLSFAGCKCRQLRWQGSRLRRQRRCRWREAPPPVESAISHFRPILITPQSLPLQRTVQLNGLCNSTDCATHDRRLAELFCLLGCGLAIGLVELDPILGDRIAFITVGDFAHQVRGALPLGGDR
jgi:hypothetical protein